MNRRTLPLMIDALPLYASKAQIVGAITTDAREQKFARVMFDWRDFPRPSALLSGLYFVPDVLAFIAQYESRRQSEPINTPFTEEQEQCEPRSKRRALRGAGAPAVKFRTG